MFNAQPRGALPADFYEDLKTFADEHAEQLSRFVDRMSKAIEGDVEWAQRVVENKRWL